MKRALTLFASFAGVLVFTPPVFILATRDDFASAVGAVACVVIAVFCFSDGVHAASLIGRRT